MKEISFPISPKKRQQAIPVNVHLLLMIQTTLSIVRAS
jgi:hypothetical protein